MAIRRITDLSAVQFDENYLYGNADQQASLQYSVFETSWNANGSEHSQFQSMQMSYNDLSTFMLDDILKRNTTFDGDKTFTGDVTFANGLKLSGNFFLNYPGQANNYVMSVNINTFTAHTTNQLNLLATNKICADTKIFDLDASDEVDVDTENIYLNATQGIYLNSNTTDINANSNITLTPKNNCEIVLDGDANSSNFRVKRGATTIMETQENKVAFADVIQGTALQALWADLAELYESDQQYLPGTLVKFGGEKEITIATDVANAVITTKPGFILNGSKPNSQGIVLVGRTPVRVVGTVRKFDNLYLSEIPGIASNAINGNPIGKALADKDFEEIGLVECVVRMQF